MYFSSNNNRDSCLPIHSPKYPLQPKLGQQKPKTENSICVSYVGGRNPTMWAIIVVSQVLHQQKAEVKSWGWVSNPSTPMWTMGILVSILTTKMNVCPHLQIQNITMPSHFVQTSAIDETRSFQLINHEIDDSQLGFLIITRKKIQPLIKVICLDNVL